MGNVQTETLYEYRNLVQTSRPQFYRYRGSLIGKGLKIHTSDTETPTLLLIPRPSGYHFGMLQLTFAFLKPFENFVSRELRTRLFDQSPFTMAKSKAATSGVTQDSKGISQPQQSVLQQPKSTSSGVIPDPKRISQPQQSVLKLSKATGSGVIPDSKMSHKQHCVLQQPKSTSSGDISDPKSSQQHIQRPSGEVISSNDDVSHNVPRVSCYHRQRLISRVNKVRPFSI